jgi:hypothetical protein
MHHRQYPLDVLWVPLSQEGPYCKKLADLTGLYKNRPALFMLSNRCTRKGRSLTIYSTQHSLLLWNVKILITYLYEASEPHFGHSCIDSQATDSNVTKIPLRFAALARLVTWIRNQNPFVRPYKLFLSTPQ